MKASKISYALLSALMLVGAVTPSISTFADTGGTGVVTATAPTENDGENSNFTVVVSSEKVSPYVFETRTIKVNPVTSIEIPDSGVKTTIDYTDAKFYDNNGVEVDKDTVIGTMVQREKAGTSGGQWSSGSGYSSCIGMKVTGEGHNVLASFKADFENIQGGYDQLNRIYGVNISSIKGYEKISEGVFRAKETGTYSAYGGIKGQAVSITGGTVTVHMYLRVGKDTYWVDSNLA